MPSPPKRGFIRAAGKRFPDAKILHRYTGVVYLGKSRAGYHIAKWPAKRGKHGTPAQMQARADFKRFTAGVMDMMDADKVGARLLAHGTSDTWRDVLSRAASGTLIEIENVEIVPVKTFLDQLGLDPGLIIVCTADGWVALDPPDEPGYLHIADGVITWVPLSVPDPAITELTGDVEAGPGSGSQAATLADTGVTPGNYLAANLSVDSKGRITAATDGSGGGGGVGGLFSASMSALPTASATGLTTWVNQGTASHIDAAVGLSLINPATSSQALRGLTKSSSSASFSATVLLQLTAQLGDNTNNPLAAIGFTDGTKFVLIGFVQAGQAGATYLVVTKYNSTTSFNSNPILWEAQGNMQAWLRAAKVSGNIVFSYSTDGEHFAPLFSESATAFLANANTFAFMITRAPASDAVANLASYSEP